MTFDGAVIKEQGVTFAITVVKPNVLNSPNREKIQARFSSVFDGLPTVLMAQDFNGVPKYYGRKDIVNFLASINMNQIPWKTYTVN